MGYQNGHVIDDVTLPQRCCERVQLALLATAWLLVKITLKNTRDSKRNALGIRTTSLYWIIRRIGGMMTWQPCDRSRRHEAVAASHNSSESKSAVFIVTGGAFKPC